jgi:hypothetical protein
MIMNRKPGNVTRRSVLVTAVAAITGTQFVQSIFSSQASAATLLRVSEDDPAAKALKYHHAAAEAPRVDKAGTPAEKQFCHNCRFIQADDGTWRPCQIFPSRAVNENGWCTSWMAKS